MRISTDASMIGDLISLYAATYWNTTSATSLYGTTYQTSASTTTGTSATGFGSATLLSLGEGTSTNAVGDYSFLASAALQLQPSTTTQVSATQQAAEQEINEQAAALRQNGSYNEARRLLEDLLEKNPTNAVAVHGLGAIELDLGNYEAAEQYFQKAHYLDPEYGYDSDVANAQILQHDDEYVLEQAEQLSQRSDTRDRATRLLVVLTGRSPSNAVARSLLAENLIRDGDGTQGLAQYQLAVSSADRTQLQQIQARLTSLVGVAPTAAYLHNLLGQTQLRLGEHEQAAETLARATQLSDNDPLYQADEALAHVALGRDAIARGDLTTAMSAFRTAYELDPVGEEVKAGLAEGYIARGKWLARMGNASGAIDEFSSAKSQLGSIENEELRDELASAFYRAGRTLESRRLSSGEKVGDEIVAFQAAYDLDPDKSTYRSKLAETRNTMGDEYLAEGDLKNAAYSYQSAYQADSNNDTYKQSAISTFLAWGDERSAAHDHISAITAYQAAYDLDKTNETAKSSLAEAFNTRGLFYKSLGEDFYDMAADDFLEALDLYPDNEEYQDNYDSVS